MDGERSFDDRPLLERVSLSRPLTSYGRVQSVLSPLLRNRYARALRKSSYLNAGCGANIRSEFVNLDYQWRPGVDVCWDLRRRLPFGEGSLDGVFCEHCLEHLTREDAQIVVRQFLRLLRAGGVLRVVVPDAGLYAETYARRMAGDRAPFPYEEDATAMEQVNKAFRGHGHLYAYDAETMMKLLRECGFSQVARVNYREGRDRVLLIDDEWRRVESLYVEAVK